MKLDSTILALSGQWNAPAALHALRHDREHKRVENKYGKKYGIKDNVPVIITKEVFKAVKEERERRSNIEVDERGKHRKEKMFRYDGNRAVIEIDDMS